MNRNRRAKRTRTRQAMTGKHKFYLSLLVAGAIIGLLAGGAVKDVIQAIDAQQRELAMEEARALQSLRIIAKQVGIIVFGIVAKVGAVVMGGYAVYFLIAIARNWLDLKARQVHARDGVFPVIRVDNGTLYDPNRALGEHPLITMGALEVQRTSALRADKIMVKQAGGMPSLPAGDDQAQIETGGDDLPNLVKLPEICQRPDLNNLVLGMGQQGVVSLGLYDLMHVLAVGASGWGKSAFLRMLIWQLAQVSQPVDVVAVDVNGSEFNVIRQWDKLLFPVARETNAAIATLQAVGNEIERRKGLYEAHPTAYDLPSYNQQAEAALNPIVLLTDEGTNLLNQAGIGEPLRDVAQTARQYGVYLLLAGQSATHKVIPTQTRDNFSSRFCFHTSPVSRRVVLGQSVANVKAKGRAWAQFPGRDIERLQVPFVSREEVAAVIRRGAPQQTIDVTLASESAGARQSQAQQIQELREQGLSLNQIQQEVFGYTGGAAYSEVKAALR